MKRRTLTLSTALILLVVSTAAQALTPIHRSSVRYGSTGGDGGSTLTVDGGGSVIVAGVFSNTVNFGGANLVSAGIYDIFLAKYFNGVHFWSQRFGGTSFDDPRAICVDASDNIYLAGTFSNTVNFGGGNLVSAGAYDIFLAKYNSAGTHLWSKRFGSSDFDFGMSVGVDGSGVYLTGYFREPIDFGGGDLTSAGLEDIFLAKFDLNGNHLWSQNFGDVNADIGYGLAVNPTGGVVVTGSFEDMVNFGGGALFSAGSSDIFLAKFLSNGVYSSSFRKGGSSADLATAVTVDGAQDVLVTGAFTSTVNFGGGDLTAFGANYDIFVAKYDVAGNHVWSRKAGGDNNDVPQTIAIDKSNNVYIAGFFTGIAYFGSDTFFGSGGPDIFLSRYSANGLYHWSRGFGGASTDVGRSIAVDKFGNVVMTGDFQGTVDFGGGGLVSAGSSDAVILKYDLYTTEPLITSIKDIGNDQGRKVKIRFDRSGIDAASAGTPVTRYVAFRKDKAAPPAAGAGDLSLLAPGWTEVGSVGAYAEESYGIDVPTIGDSTEVQGPYNSTFYIRAATNTPATFYDSRPDSGYSLDNLAPGVPLNFVYNAGQLTWDESSDADFDYFTVYGSNTDSFGASTVVDYSVAPTMNVNASPYTFYFVTATDFSGNEGNPARVNTLTGVGGAPSRYVLSVSNYPNPFNPRTTVSYTVPSRGAVSVAIYDARGARVARLFEGDRAAGAYTIEWNGRDDAGSGVSSGIYFARIEHTSGTRSKKMVLLK